MFNFLEYLFNSKPSKSKSMRTRYQVFTYISINGGGKFVFSYHQIGNGYEIDIHSQPSYKRRKHDPDTIHRINSNRDVKYKICVRSKYTPKTLEAAQDLSMSWAEYTENYIKTGVTIDMQIKIEQNSKN